MSFVPFRECLYFHYFHNISIFKSGKDEIHIINCSHSHNSQFIVHESILENFDIHKPSSSANEEKFNVTVHSRH
jgi:hypothetical protein